MNIPSIDEVERELSDVEERREKLREVLKALKIADRKQKRLKRIRESLKQETTGA